MSEKPPHEMTANEFKRRYRLSSGWPNVQRDWEQRQEEQKERLRAEAMKAAGAKVARGRTSGD